MVHSGRLKRARRVGVCSYVLEKMMGGRKDFAEGDGQVREGEDIWGKVCAICRIYRITMSGGREYQRGDTHKFCMRIRVVK